MKYTLKLNGTFDLEDTRNFEAYLQGFLCRNNLGFVDSEKVCYEDEKSKVLSVGKYTKSCLAMYMAEFEILKNHPEILTDYYKRLRIPGAVKYAKEMKKIFARTFPEE